MLCYKSILLANAEADFKTSSEHKPKFGWRQKTPFFSKASHLKERTEKYALDYLAYRPTTGPSLARVPSSVIRLSHLG